MRGKGIRNSLVSLVLIVTMLLTLGMPVFADEPASVDYVKVSSTYNGRVVVVGELGEDYAGSIVNLVILGSAGANNYDNSNVKYIDSQLVDENGNYEFSFKSTSVEEDAEDGVVDNHTLYVSVNNEDKTESVITANVSGKQLGIYEINMSQSADGVKATIDIYNLYNEAINNTVLLAAYDKNYNFIGVYSEDMSTLATEKTDKWEVTLSAESEFFANPALTYVRAFVWTDRTDIIPVVNDYTFTFSTAGTSMLMMNPGATATDRNFAWYSDVTVPTGKLVYDTKANYVANGNSFSANSPVVSATSNRVYNEDYYYHFVTLSNLTPDTAYVYSIGGEMNFENAVYEFYVDGADDDEFTFAIASDVHAGQNDANKTRWDNTLNAIKTQDSDVAFLISTGDQVTYTKYESEYEAFLYPQLTKSIPIAPAMGTTHDFGYKELKDMGPGGNWANVSNQDINLESKAGFHYNVPNMSKTQGYMPNGIGDYWFRYGDVLVMNINFPRTMYSDSSSQHYRADAVSLMTQELNKAFVADAVSQNQDAKFRILLTHISAYPIFGAESEFKDYRAMVAEICDLNNIDVTLSSHTHTYLRTLPITGGTTDSVGTIVDDGDGNTDVFTKTGDVKGTVYLSVPPVKTGWDTMEGEGLNDSTNVAYTTYGAKYYGDLTKATEGEVFGKESSYMMADVTAGSITFKLYNISNGLMDTFTINK